MPTIVERVAVSATGAQDRYFPSEEALKNSIFTQYWWDPKHGNKLIAGGALYGRKYPYLEANLIDPAGSRPGTATNVIDSYPFWTTPASDSPVPPILLTDPGAVPTSGDFTIMFALGLHGDSAAATAVSVAGENGNNLLIRTRSANRIMVGVDGNTNPNHIVYYDAATDGPKLIELIYHRDLDEMVLRVDDVTRDTKTGTTGWTQATSRLALLASWDLGTETTYGYGRGLKLGPGVVFNQSTARNSTARTLANNMFYDILPSLP